MTKAVNPERKYQSERQSQLTIEIVRLRTIWDEAVERMNDLTDGSGEKKSTLTELTNIAAKFHLESRTIADGLERELLEFAKRNRLADVTETIFKRFQYSHSLEMDKDHTRILFIRWFVARQGNCVPSVQKTDNCGSPTRVIPQKGLAW